MGISHIALPVRTAARPGLDAPAAAPRVARAGGVVRVADRALDIVSLAAITVGSIVFLTARQSLLAIAAGRYTLPSGTTWVARTDALVAQSKLGLLVAGAGIALGLVAAARYAIEARRDDVE